MYCQIHSQQYNQDQDFPSLRIQRVLSELFSELDCSRPPFFPPNSQTALHGQDHFLGKGVNRAFRKGKCVLHCDKATDHEQGLN